MTALASPQLCSLTQSACPICRAGDMALAIAYQAPPAGETPFPFSSRGDYSRQVMCCRRCGHYASRHAMDDSGLYADEYVNATYQGEKLLRTFQKVIGLPSEKSDNKGRCKRVDAFARSRPTAFPLTVAPSVLDVGSGLCVFLHEMKRLGWEGTALDPDERAIRHARETVGVRGIHGDFFAVDDHCRYDAVTFNKVLEHVSDPIDMLQRSRSLLQPDGFVYVEVPDGEIAIRHGRGEREEFFIEHHHVFSFSSLAILAQRAGFDVVAQHRLCEPSGKYTLYAFCTPSP